MIENNEPIGSNKDGGIDMDFSLSKKHEMARTLFREFAETEVKPFAQETDETEHFPTEIVKKMQAGPIITPINMVVRLKKINKISTAITKNNKSVLTKYLVAISAEFLIVLTVVFS